MDLDYLLFLQEIRQSLPPCVEHFFATLSAINVHPLLFTIPFIIYWCVDKRRGQILLTAVWLGNILNSFAKLSVCCYRPWIRNEAIVPARRAIPGATGYSFPSGHTATAVTVFGTLGWLYKKESKLLLAFCAMVIALMAFSRNFLCVHTFQDVVFGLAVGILSMFIACKFVAWSEKNTDKDLKVLLLVLGTVALVFAYFALKNYPRDYMENGELLVDPKKMMKGGLKACGYVAALATSWYLERRFIKFSMNVSVPEKICRALAGCAFMGIFNFCLNPLITGGMNFYLKNFIKGCLTVFPGALFAPLVFIPLHALFKKNIVR